MSTPKTASARPARLWKRLPADRRLEAATAFWQEEGDAASRAEAIDAIARHLRFRHKSVATMPVERQARTLASLPDPSDSLAARLLVVYHFTRHRLMMAAFLDAIGVPHENGLIAGEDLRPPDAERCRTAARTLQSQFPAEDVSIYLGTLLAQDPEVWGALAELVS